MDKRRGSLVTILLISLVFFSFVAVYEFQIFIGGSAPQTKLLLPNERVIDNSFTYNKETGNVIIGPESSKTKKRLDSLSEYDNNKPEKYLINDGDYKDVIVILKDDHLPKLTKDSLSEIESEIDTKQENILSQFNLETEIDVKHRYDTFSAFAGRITEEALKELKNNPQVEAVYDDEIYYINLMDSVPLIDADNLWNNYNLKGDDTVVCVVDTGIDYTHPALGGCNAMGTTGNIVSYPLESPHPYTNNYEDTWTITMPGFSNISVHFFNISLENYYDYIYIKDQNGTIVQSFTGDNTDKWSVSIPGDTIKISLSSDSSITRWGFKIDKILNGSNYFLGLGNCTKVIDGYDFYNNDNNPMDDHNHGTHVAGIVAANGTYKGIAPNAKLLALKVCGPQGSCSYSDMIAAVDWCNAKKSEYNIVATTMSIGGGGPYDFLCSSSINSAFKAANDLGITVTVASGNDGYHNGLAHPACSPYVISVGSTTKSDVISSFTNTGNILDVLAPGSGIFSTIIGGTWSYMSGTSMATPHVAGAVALLKQYKPSATPRQIEWALKSSGKYILETNSNMSFPRIDIDGAYDFLGCSLNEECGIQYSEDSNKYCKANDVYLNTTRYDPTCASGICDSVPILNENLVQTCPQNEPCNLGQCENTETIKLVCENACSSLSVYDFCFRGRELKINGNIFSNRSCVEFAVNTSFSDYGIKRCSKLSCLDYPPDLLVTDLIIQSIQEKKVTLAFTIKNVGGSTGDQISWAINTNSTSENTIRTRYATLNSDNWTRAYMQIDYSSSGSGTYYPKVIVDSENLITEYDETNNEQSIYVNV